MLDATPKNLFSRDYHIERDGERVAFLDSALFNREAVIELGNQRLRVERKGVLRPDYKLYLNEQEIARAHKPSVVKDVVHLRFGDADCTIRRKNLFSRRFEVWNGETRIGGVGRLKWYARRATIDLPDEWPLGLQLFVFWVVLYFWRRDQASTASG